MNATQILIPAFENGDVLTRAEFERRYQLMPEHQKAELIEGQVYMAAAAVRAIHHGRPHSLIMGWLMTYEFSTPGVMVLDNTTVRLDLDNEPQPDALLRIEESCGGQSRVSEDDYIEGAPELIVEIAGSSASYDLHHKLQVYRRNGVREYLVWVVQEREFRWHLLEEGQYRLQQPNSSGVLESPFFPGLRLDATALLAGEMQQVLAVLQQGLSSPEHQDFVARLEEIKAGEG
ncbi:Uma2 family endonuclease [Oscillatoria sp. FACHB-1406]|uniref:Uma2 family endonuclease n=1 Tax=Oscillatoria sp. FACHB-1406 TaxID=2692846 RepID=UPI00168219FD|nr:Uma2 family endonuclease [Oscillatoria sp. FACHB-1406]